jgi:hypothetical protein
MGGNDIVVLDVWQQARSSSTQLRQSSGRPLHWHAPGGLATPGQVQQLSRAGRRLPGCLTACLPAAGEEALLQLWRAAQAEGLRVPLGFVFAALEDVGGAGPAGRAGEGGAASFTWFLHDRSSHTRLSTVVRCQPPVPASTRRQYLPVPASSRLG